MSLGSSTRLEIQGRHQWRLHTPSMPHNYASAVTKGTYISYIRFATQQQGKDSLASGSPAQASPASSSKPPEPRRAHETETHARTHVYVPHTPVPFASNFSPRYEDTKPHSLPVRLIRAKTQVLTPKHRKAKRCKGMKGQDGPEITMSDVKQTPHFRKETKEKKSRIGKWKIEKSNLQPRHVVIAGS